jgi:hypothetical protein
MRLCNTPSSFVPQPLVFLSNAKNQKQACTEPRRCARPLCILHRSSPVASCCRNFSSPPFSQLAVGSRAQLRKTLRRATCFLVFFHRWLKAVFPFLFLAVFSLWVWNSYFVCSLWIQLITVLFLLYVGLTTSLTVSFQLMCFSFILGLFCCQKAPTVSPYFSIFGSGFSIRISLIGSLGCSFLIN